MSKLLVVLLASLSSTLALATSPVSSSVDNSVHNSNNANASARSSSQAGATATNRNRNTVNVNVVPTAPAQQFSAQQASDPGTSSSSSSSGTTDGGRALGLGWTAANTPDGAPAATISPNCIPISVVTYIHNLKKTDPGLAEELAKRTYVRPVALGHEGSSPFHVASFAFGAGHVAPAIVISKEGVPIPLCGDLPKPPEQVFVPQASSQVLTIREVDSNRGRKGGKIAKAADGRNLCDVPGVKCDESKGRAGQRKTKEYTIDCASPTSGKEAKLCSDAKWNVGRNTESTEAIP